MRLASYVRKHPHTGTYWYRRAVPPRLRGHLPKVAGFPDNPSRAEFSRTLRTRDKAEANRGAARLDHLVEAALADAQKALDVTHLSPSKAEGPSDDVRVNPKDALTALERWKSQQIAETSVRVFNGDMTLGLWEQAIQLPRSQYHLQQLFLGGRTERDRWQLIPHFDEMLTDALATQGIVIPVGHPALRWLRTTFAAEWWEVLRSSERMRQGLWEWGERRFCTFAPSEQALLDRNGVRNPP